ncbi:hypothetical protein [Frankia sp. AvcI1]|uniref:hypothetical protein n=1 Tax=Frankia sp. AvcI1 TaxID=573496 RepID=UPI002118BEC2|nr:hypothetical protein [Frankia sp. AvcI1]
MSSDDLVIRLEPRSEFAMVYFRVPRTLSGEMDQALRDVGAEPARIAEFGLGPVDVALGVLAAPGIWQTVRAGIEAIGARHKTKTFRLQLSGDESIEVDGHSAEETERLLKAAGDLYERRAAEWRRLSGRDSGEGTDSAGS